jgi:PEP-CTERM motif
MRSVRSALIAAAAFALLLLPTLASADGITWTLEDINFSSGGSATGTFNYNAATVVYSAVNVSTTASSPFPATSYSTVTDAFYFTPTVVGFGPNPFTEYNGGNLTGATLLELFFLNPLPSAGGTDPVYAVEYLCGDATCDYTTRTSSTGFVTTNPVSAPEPASLLLLAGGLLALALIRRLL